MSNRNRVSYIKKHQKPERSHRNSIYKQYIESSRWTDKKNAYYRSDRPQACVICGDRNFDIHHITYERFGNELLTDLVALCRGHHDLLHKERQPAWDLEKWTYTFIGREICQQSVRC